MHCTQEVKVIAVCVVFVPASGKSTPELPAICLTLAATYTGDDNVMIFVVHCHMCRERIGRYKDNNISTHKLLMHH